MPEGGFTWTTALSWAWTNRGEVLGSLKKVREWFRSGPGRGILIIGPGGAGKTTLARILSGENVDWLVDEPWKYDQSFGIEHYTLKDDPKAAITVLPGEPDRREVYWSDIEGNIRAGRYRGIVFVTSYGHHTPPPGSYKDHPLYEGHKDSFWKAYHGACLRDELSVLHRLVDSARASPGKLWLLSVVTKQDLWYPTRSAAEEHYTGGEYVNSVGAIAAVKAGAFRHVSVSVSLVISNLMTSEGEVLRKNVEGYDHQRQVGSVRRLFELAKELAEWEKGR